MIRYKGFIIFQKKYLFGLDIVMQRDFFLDLRPSIIEPRRGSFALPGQPRMRSGAIND